MKRRHRILIALLSLATVVLMVLVANVMRSHSQVRGIEVDIRYGDTPHLVSEQVVVDSVLAALPHINTMRVADVNLKKVAIAAAHVPYLDNVMASVSVSGRVVVRAEQRRPIARLFYGGREFYIDAKGAVIPMSREGQCNVLVAGGDFVEPLRLDSVNYQVTELYRVASFLDKKDKYGDMIDQIYVQADGDVMMVPKLGDHVVELGTPDSLDEKFSNLWTFYRNGMPRAGWDTYSLVSLKFNQQVVCKKKENN